MKIKCDKCKKNLIETGALLFSPPLFLTKAIETELDNIHYDCLTVRKIHLCKNCWKILLKWLFK